ncbi:MAG: hypothetical protein K2K24_03530, partial [Clostridia bacterium]|nr:hypothetical protein [Clostridia bacterium]
MAGYKKNKIKQIQSPQKSREIVSADKGINRSISHREDPNKFYDGTPSWCFHLCDKDMWTLDESKSLLFWNEILP